MRFSGHSYGPPAAVAFGRLPLAAGPIRLRMRVNSASSKQTTSAASRNPVQHGEHLDALAKLAHTLQAQVHGAALQIMGDAPHAFQVLVRQQGSQLYPTVPEYRPGTHRSHLAIASPHRQCPEYSQRCSRACLLDFAAHRSRATAASLPKSQSTGFPLALECRASRSPTPPSYGLSWPADLPVIRQFAVRPPGAPSAPPDRRA